MKKFLVLAGLAALSSVSAFGISACVTGTDPTFTQGSYDTFSGMCIVDGAIFTNFAVYGGSGFTTPGLTFSVTVVNNSLQFTTTTLVNDDIEIYFQTSPGISQVTLQTGPSDTAVETVCGDPFNQSSGSELCSDVLNTSLLSSTNGSIAMSTVLAPPNGTDYFVKDDSGGSQLAQMFAPEPMTFSLMGVGLLGLGLLGRRMRK